MEMWIALYVIGLTVAHLSLLVYLFYERYSAFKKQGESTAKQILAEHFASIQLQEQAILEQFRAATQEAIANTQLAGQQTLAKLNENMIQSHTQNQQRFSEFSSKLYGVLVDSGNQFSTQLSSYVTDANKRIDEWQSAYIEIMKHEIDGIIEVERQKLSSFTEDEQKRIQSYMREQVNKEVSVIVEEVLSGSISTKDQERLAQAAIERFFKEV